MIGASLLSALLLSLRSASASCGSCQTYGPRSPSEAAVWLDNLVQERNNFGFKGGVFDKVPWTQTAYIQPQSHPYDRYFYDPDKGYTIDRFLKDLTDRYGGIDAVLVWPTYTNIGIDDRNQFDYFRVMPGGLEGVANATAALKAAGVRVLWPYNPWDTGTRREPLSDEDTFAKLLKQTGGDGFNGDTMGYVPQSFWTAAQKVDYPLAFEPEAGGTDSSLDWTTMGWGYWNYPDGAPIVDRFKWLTSGEFLTNVCDRWAFTKTNNLQFAWFNGDGYESWENVWGTWNGITPYDGEAIRRVGTMLRYFGGKGYLQSPDWVPHTTDVWQTNVYASKFPLNGSVVYTIINRGANNITAGLAVESGKYYYDCYHGMELHTDSHPPVPDSVVGYAKYQGGNCYNGHGGSEIDNNPLPDKSAMECANVCSSTANCQCFTYDPDTKECWRRSNCQPSGFEFGNTFDTYVKAKGYAQYSYKNAYEGHGGVKFGDDRDNNGNGIAVSSATACQTLCDQTKGCECATYGAGKCWPLKGCAPSYFQGTGTYTVFVSLEHASGMHPPSGANVTFPLEAHGYGCVVQTDQPASGDLVDHLAKMAKMSERSLHSYDATWRYLPQTMVPSPPTKPQTSAPAGTVYIPKAVNWTFVTGGVEIEGDDGHGVDVQFPWEDHPQRNHKGVITLGPFYMDKFPVTNANYSNYLADTKYTPKDPYNWLKNWNGARTPPSNIAELPVTYVGLEEARAFCAWKGARLPQVFEWQYAAQGTDGRTYPWGWGSDTWRYPGQSSTFYGPQAVTQHVPNGNSPFGVSDLIGNVWQYTSEFQDDHTRSVLLKGGSNYRPRGSYWYFPQAKKLTQHNKYFLMNNRYERAGTVGFRCVYDAATSRHHTA